MIFHSILTLIDFHAPEVQAVLDTLLKDKSTGKNIIWATDPPEELQTVMTMKDDWPFAVLDNAQCIDQLIFTD